MLFFGPLCSLNPSYQDGNDTLLVLGQKIDDAITKVELLKKEKDQTEEFISGYTLSNPVCEEDCKEVLDLLLAQLEEYNSQIKTFEKEKDGLLDEASKFFFQ